MISVWFLCSHELFTAGFPKSFIEKPRKDRIMNLINLPGILIMFILGLFHESRQGAVFLNSMILNLPKTVF